MHNAPAPSPPAYMFRTPHAPSHAHYTPLAFSPGFPAAHDHPLFLQHAPYGGTGAAALPRSGYASPAAPHVPYPLAPPAHRLYLHKAQPECSDPPLTEPDVDHQHTMAISLHGSIHTVRASAPAEGSGSDGGGSRDGGNGSGSDGGREPTPPGGAHPRARDGKKKIHHCWMCHKSFDRPSTLKKHLLVHTGEKAFACESCGRRFGVASNLNRHAKTCRAANPPGPSAQRAAESSSPVASTSQAAVVASPASTTSDLSAVVVAPAPPDTDSTPSSATTSTARRPSRKRKAPLSAEDSHTPETMTTDRHPRSRKRARRAPSPSLWVPDSLKAFDLTPLTKSTPVPLPPVRPFAENNQTVEERDSYDENASATPYHPRGWKGRLPGPGLLGTNVANRSGGQLLIF